MTVLKKDYEAVFKEGFKLGTRLARAKINLMRANDSRMINDEPMMKHSRSMLRHGRNSQKIVGVSLHRLWPTH